MSVTVGSSVVTLIMALSAHADEVHRLLRKVHEAVAPLSTKDAESGGATGTVTPSSLVRILETMKLTTSSVFCDVGCGTGRVALTAAGVEMKASRGFDIDPLQVMNACVGWARVTERLPRLPTPVYLFRRDAFKMESLDPATHVYCFAGYADIVKRVARLAARSTTVQTLAMIPLRQSTLVECGLWGEDVITLTGTRMAGGRQYACYVMPMTVERCERVDRAMREGEPDDLMTATTVALGPDARTMMRHTIDETLSSKRARRGS